MEKHTIEQTNWEALYDYLELEWSLDECEANDLRVFGATLRYLGIPEERCKAHMEVREMTSAHTEERAELLSRVGCEIQEMWGHLR